jgi:predicted TIM-barrel enzyme
MKIYPVIHFLDRKTAWDQAEIIKQCGADGVFLINHFGDDTQVLDIAWEIKQRYIHDNFAIGINLLNTMPSVAARFAIQNSLDMIWADDMGVSSQGITDEGIIVSALAQGTPEVKFFASVAFKYQRTETDPVSAAYNATNAGFIATTSGAATGSAPDLAKIISMSYGGNSVLAIASGMTPDNISKYAPYLSYVLVATGVSKSDYCVDEDKLKLFIINARAHEAKPVTPEKRTDIAIADALDQAARNIDTSSGVASAASQLRDMADEWRSK